MTEHKEVCFKKIGKQTVKLKCGSIKFKIYHKQLALPFKISDVMWNKLRVLIKVVIEVMMHHRLKNINHKFLAVLWVLVINLANQLFSTEEKMQFINSLKQFLQSVIIAKKW